VPFYWEAYNKDPAGTLAEMEKIADTAQKLHIYVFFDCAQYGTSSYFYNSPGKGGFPSTLLTKYTFNGKEAAEKLFWNDLYNNTIKVDGVTAWELQARMFQDIIKRVDKYNSVLGYELLNEPTIYDNSQYAKLGNYHSYLVDHMRTYGTSKFILFDRAYPFWDASYLDWNYYSKIAPSSTKNTIFTPHRYSAVYKGIFENYEKLALTWGGIPVIMSEWAQGNQTKMNDYVAELKRVGFGWTYYAWAPGDLGDKQRLLDLNFDPQIFLSYLTNARELYY
jgi:hypothetical protein